MRTFTSLSLALAISAAASSAAPIQWTVANGGNGHWYEYVPAPTIFAPISFATANAAATAANWQGQSGYLATITSSAEQQFILGSFAFLTGFGGGGNFWIGAADTAVEGEFRWIGGPEAGNLIAPPAYTGWSPSEPSNLQANLDYVLVSVNVANFLNGNWGTADGSGAFGYLIEYADSPSPNPAAVPEPSAWALAASALAMLAFWHRRS